VNRKRVIQDKPQEAKGEIMPRYLDAAHHPDDYHPFVETEETIEKIHALNREPFAAGARKFACGISPAGSVVKSYAAGSHGEGRGEEQ
jgi:hypothetical protein